MCSTLPIYTIIIIYYHQTSKYRNSSPIQLLSRDMFVEACSKEKRENRTKNEQMMKQKLSADD